MRIVRRDEMRGIDERASSEFGIPTILLMENAGRAVAETIEEYLGTDGLRALMVCGKGNNGGDGFVVARHLANRGAFVEIILLARVDDLKGDALTNARIAEKMGLPIDEVLDEDGLASWIDDIDSFDVVVDAILGTGFKGKPDELAQKAIELVNESEGFVVSVDLPSGIEADGMLEKPGTAVQADVTVTMAYLKPCHVLYPTMEYCGEVWVADIGIPGAIFDGEGHLRLMTSEDASLLVPSRVPWGNKATFGKVLVVAGSQGMSGAARLACEAAGRSGAGIVYLGFPATMSGVFDSSLLEVVKKPLADTGDGHISSKALEEIMSMVEDVNVLAIGPGLGTHPETVELVKKLFKQWKKPLIIDADGINAIASEPGLLEGKKPPLILTPHPGEFGRLTDMDAKQVDSKRLDLSEEYAKKWGTVLALKGAPTVTGCPSETWVNSTGNSGLASGGTGDVLTGIIAGLVAQKMPLSPAARLGVWLHGKAADIAIEDIGEHSLLAGDLLRYLPQAFASLEEDDNEEECDECHCKDEK